MPQPSTTNQDYLFLSCPLCQGRRLYYAFSLQSYRVVRCATCSLLLLNPQPNDAELAAIYSADYFLGDDTPSERARMSEMKAATARHYLSQLRRYRGPEKGKLLEIGCGHGELLLEAQHYGYDIFGIEISPSASAIANQRLGSNRVT